MLFIKKIQTVRYQTFGIRVRLGECPFTTKWLI